MKEEKDIEMKKEREKGVVRPREGGEKGGRRGKR